ncbi:MAG: hypothetical protein FWC95_03325 [Defluviitaleaceae bacterium]|nr:hypothetical protein [Defluviitaleaceae bacterium]
MLRKSTDGKKIPSKGTVIKFSLIMLVAGVLLMVLMRVGDDERDPQHITPAISNPPVLQTQADTLCVRLAEMLSLVEGAGKVRVLIHESRSYETVFARNTTSDRSVLTEEDAAGGVRDNFQERTTETIVTINRREGGETPLVLYENAPRIEGVLIVAEGGGNIVVRDALVRAASGLLGIPIHNVIVLPMER